MALLSICRAAVSYTASLTAMLESCRYAVANFSPPVQLFTPFLSQDTSKRGNVPQRCDFHRVYFTLLLNLMSLLKDLSISRVSPSANVQNRHSPFFTKQNRFYLINSMQYFGLDPKARTGKRKEQPS